MRIHVSKSLTNDAFVGLCDKWDANDSVSVRVDVVEAKEIRAIFDLAVVSYEREFAKVVIAEIAEHPDCTQDLLAEILALPDQAARETVCLRHDLSPVLRSKCEELKLEHSVSPGSNQSGHPDPEI